VIHSFTMIKSGIPTVAW